MSEKKKFREIASCLKIGDDIIPIKDIDINNMERMRIDLEKSLNKGFCNGIAEQIKNELNANILPGMKKATRNSVLRIRGFKVDISFEYENK